MRNHRFFCINPGGKLESYRNIAILKKNKEPKNQRIKQTNCLLSETKKAAKTFSF